ncbi:Transposon Tn7 transposition protein TnsC [Andreprevotia sp. IGB-42]|uniref:ATP-binding protein n=1 Tax=Andreprevotia sp. IGB-42 TaxID=2497473 RepID=UPI001358DF45|nr:ATP-binding protein [Andreprevotia sp. IGB-42]KAF0813932.1 Transposon Tn7 transposition protein TnsC [Andreprevotia sp. IGB-42]
MVMENKKPSLPEYSGNPFISCLPNISSQAELIKSLACHPLIDATERNYPAELRKHCIMRLARYFEPMERQIQLAERFDMLLRQGYIGRNPLTHNYLRHLQNGVERIAKKDLNTPSLHAVENTATSFALTGCSGIGKSKSIEKVLHQIPQCIAHSEPFSLIQLTWLKLDCPSKGTPKQLCINFFSAVDRLIGTEYLSWYGNKRKNVDEMMVHMAHIANLHAVGVIVIDEIQHLRGVKTESESLLNFLVTLVNTIGVPVILIGTLSAIPLLQENFRQARRASGLGALTWDRHMPGKSWDYFVDRMWAYQWTRDVSPLTAEIRAVLYDESQGIIDIVVKFFMLAQMRLVTIGEIRGTPEIITAELLRKIAREDFKLIQPMISALRQNDLKALQKFDDLLPFQEYVIQLLNTALDSPTSTQEPYSAATLNSTNQYMEGGTEVQVRAALRSLGVADDMGAILLADALRDNPSEDPLSLILQIAQRLASEPAKLKRKKVQLKEAIPRPSLDLRTLVQAAKSKGRSGYDGLREVSIIKSLFQAYAR